MDPDDIAAKLETLGLGDDEARIYVQLLQTGPAKVSELVPHLSVSRTSLYRVLDALCERGYVAKSLDRPTTYEAQPPETVFEMARRKLQAQQDRIDDIEADLADPLQTIMRGSIDDRDHHWKRLDGFPQIYETIQNLAGRAEEVIQLVSNDPVSIAFDNPAVEKAWRVGATRVRDDVRARLLLGFTQPLVPELPDWVQLDNAEFRRFQADAALHFMLMDKTDVVVWAQPVQVSDPEEKAIALWTDAPGLVAPLSMFFETLWAGSEPFELPHSTAGMPR